MFVSRCTRNPRIKDFWVKRAITTTNKPHFPFYDFRRFEQLNNGKKINWPCLDQMTFSIFSRPDVDETDDEVFNTHIRASITPFSKLRALLPEQIEIGQTGILSGTTKHDGSLIMGIYDNPNKKPTAQISKHSIDRYFLKFSPSHGSARRGAKNEVLFSYIMMELGENEHAPKIGSFAVPLLHPETGSTDSLYAVMRRFYQGQDGRFLEDPDAPIPPSITTDSLLRQFFIRYFLLNDLDRHNPGNLLFTRHSRLTQKCLVHIDTEDILPNEETMAQYPDTAWSRKDPIPYSLAWLDQQAADMGTDELFYRMLISQNPIMMLLRRLEPTWEEDPLRLGDLKIPTRVISKSIQSLPFISQLARSFGNTSLEVLQRGDTHFQQVINRITTSSATALSLKQIATGQIKQR